MLPFMFQPEATGVPFRILNVEPGESFAVDAITVMNIYPRRIVSLRVGADIRPNAMPPVDDVVLGLRSASIPTSIEPGSTARISARFITPTDRAESEHSLGVEELGVNLYPAFASFEDGSSWVGGPLPLSPPLSIPRALISTIAPKPADGPNDIWTCYDAEAHQTSEGGVAVIREDPSRFVRCTNGRWVETTLR